MHPCVTPTCGVLVPKGTTRCTSCQQKVDAARGSASERGYDAAWSQVRDVYALEHPECEDHLDRGERVPMQIVDHKTPLRAGGERLDPANLRSLCRSCHGFKTVEDLKRWPEREDYVERESVSRHALREERTTWLVR